MKYRAGVKFQFSDYSAKFYTSSAETVQAMAGAHNIREKEESQQVTRLRRFVKHPNYNEFLLTADLASLEFVTPLTFNGFVQERGFSLRFLKNFENHVIANLSTCTFSR